MAVISCENTNIVEITCKLGPFFVFGSTSDRKVGASELHRTVPQSAFVAEKNGISVWCT